jgi:hypothetical protein
MLVSRTSGHPRTNYFSKLTLRAYVFVIGGAPAKTEQILLPFKAERHTLFFLS